MVLETFKNTLPMVQNGVLRFDNEATIHILGLLFAKTISPIQRAISSNLPVPSLSVRNFSTSPNFWGVMLGTREAAIGNLSLFKELQSVRFSGEYLRETVLEFWGKHSGVEHGGTEHRVHIYLQWILRNMGQHKKRVPDFNIPKLGIWDTNDTGQQELKWVKLLLDDDKFLGLQRTVDWMTPILERSSNIPVEIFN